MSDSNKKIRVLITGSRGFLGKAIIELLGDKENYEVITTNSSLHNLENLEECKIATKDIDIIIHLAGLVLSRNEQQLRPAEVFTTNTLTTINIAESAKVNKVRRVIFIGSVTAYPEKLEPPFTESDLWRGPVAEANYAYGTAKRITETIARAYRDQYAIETCVLFLPNLYGPNDKFTNTPPPLIPSIISQIHKANEENKAVIKGGNNGDAELDILYVADAAQAIYCALTANELPIMVNISTGSTISIKNIYKTIANVLKYKGIIEWEPGNVPNPRKMDSTLAHQYLAWKSTVSFETGITHTIDSYLK